MNTRRIHSSAPQKKVFPFPPKKLSMLGFHETLFSTTTNIHTAVNKPKTVQIKAKN